MAKLNSRLDVDFEDRSTTIRLDESTKQLLASVAVGQESFNDTIKRMVLTYKNLNENGPQIIKKNNMVGTSFERIRRTFEGFDTPYGSFDVVVSFNDVRSIIAFRFNKALFQALHENSRGSTEWALDLEILDIKKTAFQQAERNNRKKDEKFDKLTYFLLLTKIFKEILQIPMYEFIIEKDYTSPDKWHEFYRLNNLPEESFERDIEKKLRDMNFNE